MSGGIWISWNAKEESGSAGTIRGIWISWNAEKKSVQRQREAESDMNIRCEEAEADMIAGSTTREIWTDECLSKKSTTGLATWNAEKKSVQRQREAESDMNIRCEEAESDVRIICEERSESDTKRDLDSDVKKSMFSYEEKTISDVDQI
ncbi:hypothetical protein F511_15311 [Dorcoceras hygrometricum]|uniref:Uncharacterized protein n=1 Tax=Dorcoceras hygrometricum TaxID=472368 RepID=A0A2Z7BZ31_9LAMI|nr:hypothetical protein F511_15311 [Dorcoceras hygrometricum]